MSAPVAEIEGAEGPLEPVLVPPQGLVLWVLLSLLATAIGGVLLPGQHSAMVTPSLALTTWLPDARELATVQQRRAALLAAMPADSLLRRQQEQRILDALRALMTREARLGVAGARADVAARRARGELEEAVRNYVLAHGSDALRALAVAYGRDVRRAVEQAVASLARSGGSLSAPPDEPTSRKLIADLDRIAPGSSRAFDGVGLRSHMAGERLRPAAALVVEAVAEQRVLILAQRVPAPRPTLDSDLERLLHRFRVEAHASLGLQRRLQLLESLAARDPSYPERYVTGVLLARDGRFRAAMGAFGAAARAGESPRQARANGRWCRQQLRKKSAADAP